MDKINFVNGSQPAINDTNLNKLQDNIEKEIKVNSQSISIGNVYKIGRLVCLTILYTSNITNLASNTAHTIAKLADTYKPEKLTVGYGIVKDTSYKPLNNSYIQIRPTGDVEIYQNSGSSQNIAQVLATILYISST